MYLKLLADTNLLPLRVLCLSFWCFRNIVYSPRQVEETTELSHCTLWHNASKPNNAIVAQIVTCFCWYTLCSDNNCNWRCIFFFKIHMQVNKATNLRTKGSLPVPKSQCNERLQKCCSSFCPKPVLHSSRAQRKLKGEPSWELFLGSHRCSSLLLLRVVTQASTPYSWKCSLNTSESKSKEPIREEPDVKRVNSVSLF